MGMAKNMAIEYEDRGYGEIDKSACIDCVGDHALKEFIVNNGSYGECDYCGQAAQCIEVEELIRKILEGAYFEYSRAIEELAYDQEDGCYAGITFDHYEFFYDVLNDEEEMELSENLLSDVYETVYDEVWCHNNPYADSENHIRKYVWSEFCELVKYRARYVFFRTSEKVMDEQPHSILDYIGAHVDTFNLIVTMPPSSLFYRGRMHDSNSSISTAEQLCSPPCNCAAANRMSAEGISIFYGSDDIQTTVAEIYSSQYSMSTIAPFENLRKLLILDLTKLNQIPFPSLFDSKERHLRAPFLFLRELDQYLTRPIETLQGIEYVPTQIVAEYFRYIYKYKGKQIDGIAYTSSKNPGGKCYALFFDQTQCLSHDEMPFTVSKAKSQEMRIIEKEINRYSISVKVQFHPLTPRVDHIFDHIE